ncbi:malate dehydrogenase [Candidatus Omnitrophota bacterium]
MKVAIIGSGDVGTAAAQRIVEADLADVVLIDIVQGRAQARALDLSSAASIVGYSRKIKGSGDYQDISAADIVVVTAGKTRSAGESRADLLQKNAKIIKRVCEKIVQYCPQAIVIVVTNPLDVMTYLVYQTTKFPAKRIIGMGGVSDCARFNMLSSLELNTTANQVRSVIIGPHSDNMVILSRLTTVSGKAITDLLAEEKIKRIVDATRGFGVKMVSLLEKGSAYIGPAAGIFQLVESIINDRQETLCVCAYLSGHYGIKDLSIGVPAKIGRTGIAEIVELKLNEKEKAEFQDAAKKTQELLKLLGK